MEKQDAYSLLSLKCLRDMYSGMYGEDSAIAEFYGRKAREAQWQKDNMEE